MFRCDHKKSKWYLERDLAILVQDNPYTIQLTFEPKGKGHVDEPFYLSEKENKCVICGVEDDLTRHHCVPYCYRKFFPSSFKNFTSHDVLPICVYHHKIYEDFATNLKKEVSYLYNAPLEGFEGDIKGRKYSKKIARAKSYSRAIIKHGNKIPKERREEMLAWLEEFVGDKITEESLHDMIMNLHPSTKNEMYVHHGKIVVDKLLSDGGNQSIQEFCIMWREHFVNHMDPKFLPELWSLTYRPARIEE